MIQIHKTWKMRIIAPCTDPAGWIPDALRDTVNRTTTPTTTSNSLCHSRSAPKSPLLGKVCASAHCQAVSQSRRRGGGFFGQTEIPDPLGKHGIVVNVSIDPSEPRDPTYATVVDDLGRLREAINRVVQRRVVSRRSIEVRETRRPIKLRAKPCPGRRTD